jgi:hypothetical protein
MARPQHMTMQTPPLPGDFQSARQKKQTLKNRNR